MKKDEKIIAFPGMVNRLLEQAELFVQQQQYEEAVDALEQALQYDTPNESSLIMYAYCLYELKRYADMKEACEQLLALKPSHYFEVMELYVTALMQLKEFKQVEKLIETMKQERLIPANQLERFNRLQQLNSNVAEKKEQQALQQQPIDQHALLEVNTFIQLSNDEQLLLLQQLTERNIRPYVHELTAILEHHAIHPFVQSLLLILFVEQDIQAHVHIQKFGQSMQVETASLALPTALPKFEALAQRLYAHYEQEPSTLELVEFLLSKHAIVMYPFDYLQYDVEQLVEAYIQFVHRMFGAEIEADDELLAFIEQLEKLSELP